MAIDNPFHTSVPITEYNARSAFPSQSIPVPPKNSINLLKTPYVGFINAVNVIPTAMVLTRFGKKTINRIIFFVRIALVRKTAIKKASTTFKPDVKAA